MSGFLEMCRRMMPGVLLRAITIYRDPLEVKFPRHALARQSRAIWASIAAAAAGESTISTSSS